MFILIMAFGLSAFVKVAGHHIESLNESEGWVDLEKQEGLTLEKIGFNLAIGFEDTLLLPEYGKIVMEHGVKSHTEV
jgi:hypothetical protein